MKYKYKRLRSSIEKYKDFYVRDTIFSFEFNWVGGCEYNKILTSNITHAKKKDTYQNIIKFIKKIYTNYMTHIIIIKKWGRIEIKDDKKYCY